MWLGLVSRQSDCDLGKIFILSYGYKSTSRKVPRASIPVIWCQFNHVPSFQVVARRYEPPELFTGLDP